jgi:hypothetical protein
MDNAEYLAFVPLLLYGIALGDLLGQWKRFFRRESFYWPYFLTTIMFTEWGISNVFEYNQVVQRMDGVAYPEYLLLLVQPMIFMTMVSALTPEGDDPDTKRHFAQRARIVFSLCGFFILVQTLPFFGVSVAFDFVGLGVVLMCAVIAVTQKIWPINLLGVLWFFGLMKSLGALAWAFGASPG